MLVAHAPGMPGTFSPPPTSIETTSERSRYASRHVRDAGAVMHVRIATVAGKTFTAFPTHAQPAILRIWQKAYGGETTVKPLLKGVPNPSA